MPPRHAPLTWRRLAGRSLVVALAALVLAALGETLGTVVAGRLADGPTATLLAALAVLLVGAAVADTAGRTVFSALVGRAEGRLRADLVDAAWHQPLPVIEEQGVGEVLDRIDDDPYQVSTLLRFQGWQMVRAVVRSTMAWVVAGLTWWPAWVAFPVVAATVVALAWRRTPAVAAAKVVEEARWSDHAAQLEEAVAGRDDVRTSLGQAHVVRQYARRAAAVLDAAEVVCRVTTGVMVRTGLVLHALLAALAVGAVVLVGGGRLGVSELVTLWLLVTTFVGQLSQVTNHLPEAQEGLGALTRIGALLRAPVEPVGGALLPPGPAGVELDGLSVGYPGGFALAGVSLEVPAGTTCAVVGRSGAGKSTLAKVLSRAVEPERGQVRIGGIDVRDLDVEALRARVGVVTQRTELLAATLEENITLFAPVPRGDVEAALAALGLSGWAASLPDGLDTRLGVGATTLSAGEEQLVAFARLLVRDVAVVVLDEATARMDPRTEARVERASAALLAGRTGVIIAHRLATTERAQTVAVLDAGRLVQHGARAGLARVPGPFADLLAAAAGGGDGAGGDGAGGDDGVGGTGPRGARAAGSSGGVLVAERPAPARSPSDPADPAAGRVGRAGALADDPGLAARAARREPAPPPAPQRPSVARGVVRLMAAHPRWGLVGGIGFLATTLLGAYGAVTNALFGHLVAGLRAGEQPWWLAGGLALALLCSPLALAVAFRVYPMWWSSVELRLRLGVLRGQTMQHRLARTPPGEVSARALDSERFATYTDRWVDVVVSVVTVAATGLVTGSALAVAVVSGVLVVSALVSTAGAPLAGSSARVAGDQRALFGRSLVSAMDAARTVKLAAATSVVQRHLVGVDAVRMAASVREFRVRALLDGVPVLMVQLGVVAAWAALLAGAWDLPTALAVAGAVSGFGWFGTVAGAVITQAPVARRWLRAATDLSGGVDLTSLPAGVDLRAGTAPAPAMPPRVTLERLELSAFDAVHDDGTVGVAGVDLCVAAGELVLLAGRVGSGKSSLLAAIAGLVEHTGSIRWNGHDVDDPQVFLRPGQVAWVGQVPRVLSGSVAENVALDHERGVDAALEDARLGADLAAAGGHATVVGHRGVRLSGGQVQRLALARALAAGAELLVADDVSSALDARTEVELWEALRARGATVLGSSAKRAALVRADRVVVLDGGRVAEVGPWALLSARWGHLAA